MVFFSCTFGKKSQAQERADSKSESSKLYAEVNVLTNYVSKGIAQTQKDPAFQAGFGYKLNSARFGLWGSNVKYEGTDEHLNMRAYIGYDFFFTSNVDMLFRYDFSRYYKSGTRNGTILSFDLNLFSYHVLHEREDNFEGLKGERSWYAFRKEWQIPWSLFFEATIGYSTISTAGYNNYFDSDLQVKYKTSAITYALGSTFNSAASQFGTAGSPSVYLSMSGKW